MRAIKFRGKSLHDGDWYYGNLYDKDVKGRTHIGTTQCGCLCIDPDTVGEFTGLTDSQGHDIYEGDILHEGDPTILYQVVWRDCGLQGKQVGSNSYIGLTHGRDRLVVIGNIYDNPELIKKED